LARSRIVVEYKYRSNNPSTKNHTTIPRLSLQVRTPQASKRDTISQANYLTLTHASHQAFPEALPTSTSTRPNPTTQTPTHAIPNPLTVAKHVQPSIPSPHRENQGCRLQEKHLPLVSILRPTTALVAAPLSGDS